MALVRAWSLLYVVASSLAILSMFACLLAILFVLGKQLWGTFRPRQTCRPLVASVCCCQQKEKCTLTCQDRHRHHHIITITIVIIIILLPTKREMHADLSGSSSSSSYHHHHHRHHHYIAANKKRNAWSVKIHWSRTPTITFTFTFSHLHFTQTGLSNFPKGWTWRRIYSLSRRS